MAPDPAARCVAVALGVPWLLLLLLAGSTPSAPCHCPRGEKERPSALLLPLSHVLTSGLWESASCSRSPLLLELAELDWHTSSCSDCTLELVDRDAGAAAATRTLAR